MLDTGLDYTQSSQAATMLEPSSFAPTTLVTPIINFNSFDTGVTENKADQKDLQAVYEQWSIRARLSKIRDPLDGAFHRSLAGTKCKTG